MHLRAHRHRCVPCASLWTRATHVRREGRPTHIRHPNKCSATGFFFLLCNGFRIQPGTKGFSALLSVSVKTSKGIYMRCDVISWCVYVCVCIRVFACVGVCAWVWVFLCAWVGVMIH